MLLLFCYSNLLSFFLTIPVNLRDIIFHFTLNQISSTNPIFSMRDAIIIESLNYIKVDELYLSSFLGVSNNAFYLGNIICSSHFLLHRFGLPTGNKASSLSNPTGKTPMSVSAWLLMSNHFNCKHRFI